MKMRRVFLVMGLLLPLLLSCRQEEIQKTKEAEEADIKEAVFRYLFKHSFSGPQAHWGAYYLAFWDSTERDPADEFMNRFQGHQPPVKKFSQCVESDVVTDKETGKPGVVFTIAKIRWVNLEQVEVEGNHVLGGLGGAVHMSYLSKKRGHWVVTKDLKGPVW